MKLPMTNDKGSSLYVYIYGDVYGMNIYQNFDTKKELDEYMKDNFGVNRKQYSYYYG